jgi:hypothetical protein
MQVFAMESRSEKIKPCISSGSVHPQDSVPTKVTFNVNQYESMLYQIATAFGFGAKSYNEFVEQAYLTISRRSSTFRWPTRIEMAKAVVHQCVYKISCGIFSQKSQATSFPGTAVQLNYQVSAHLSKMPLSFRTVYILFQVGCSEEEIAYILNINTIQVKERLRKATMIIYY